MLKPDASSTLISCLLSSRGKTNLAVHACFRSADHHGDVARAGGGGSARGRCRSQLHRRGFPRTNHQLVQVPVQRRETRQVQNTAVFRPREAVRRGGLLGVMYVLSSFSSLRRRGRPLDPPPHWAGPSMGQIPLPGI